MTDDLLDRLRAATGPAHRRLDGRLGLTDPGLSRAGYIAILARLHGFWRSWQPLAEALLADPAFTQPRRRLHLLEADLATLGFAEPDIEALPICPPPPLRSAGAALGSLYVQEGSTLGGRVILKAIAPRLGLSETAGCRYFAGYGAETGPMWKAFLRRLTAVPSPLAPAIITGACATFDTLANWLESVGWVSEASPADHASAAPQRVVVSNE